MAHTAASRYQLDVETELSGDLGMTAYPSDFESIAQVLAPGVEYFSVLASQSQIFDPGDANNFDVELQIRLRLLYRFVINEAEYTGSGDTPSKHKAALATFMDKRWWEGQLGLTLTAPLDVQNIETPELDNIVRTGRVLETVIQVQLVTAFS